MIVVDASVWIDFLRFRGASPSNSFVGQKAHLLVHDFVLGELSLGNFRDRKSVFRWLNEFEKAPIAASETVTDLMENLPLHGTGVGYVDAHLLASTLLIEDGKLWTRDRRLRFVAERLGVLAGAE